MPISILPRYLCRRSISVAASFASLQTHPACAGLNGSRSHLTSRNLSTRSACIGRASGYSQSRRDTLNAIMSELL